MPVAWLRDGEVSLRLSTIIAVAVAATLALSSCAPSYDPGTRDSLRQHVVAVSEASAAGDWQAALSGLDALAAEATSAREAGKVDEQRFEKITLAMELVRQDLEVAIAAAEDEAERQRLQEEQARLQEQIDQMQNQGDSGENETGNGDDGDKEKNKSDDKGGSDDKEGKD